VADHPVEPSLTDLQKGWLLEADRDYVGLWMIAHAYEWHPEHRRGLSLKDWVIDEVRSLLQTGLVRAVHLDGTPWDLTTGEVLDRIRQTWPDLPPATR